MDLILNGIFKFYFNHSPKDYTQEKTFKRLDFTVGIIPKLFWPAVFLCSFLGVEIFLL